MVITVYNTQIHTRTWVVSAEVVVGRGGEFVEEAVDGVGLLVDDGHDEVLTELQSRFVPRPVVQTLVPCRKQHNIISTLQVKSMPSCLSPNSRFQSPLVIITTSSCTLNSAYNDCPGTGVFSRRFY